MKTSSNLIRLLLWAGSVLCATCFARAEERKTVIFFGDSLTAGHGLPDPATQAYPALIQKKIDDAGLPWRVINAGLSGETSAGGLSRVDWVLRQPVNLFVLELGGNDGLRGIPPGTTKANLQAIIDRVRAKDPSAGILLIGIKAPPNMGPDFTRAFDAIFPALAKENHLPFVPFLLAGVVEKPGLIQGDGIHPTARGDVVLADTVWRVLKPLL